MDDYIGKICPFCKTEIREEDEVKVCPSCGIPHHQSCWEENKGCTTFGCSEQHYEEQHTNPTDVCVKCGAPLGDGQAFCPKCGTPKGGDKKKICSKCGVELEEGQAFCPKCGQKADLQLDTSVNSAISQFNASVEKANSAKKKTPVKIIIAVIAVIAIIVAGIVIVPKLFVSVDELCAQGNYVKAYDKAKTTEQKKVADENLVAFICDMCVDSLKDSKSFELRNAWIEKGTNDDGNPICQIVLTVAANNSYGNTVINYWMYSWDNEDREYQYIASYSSLSEESTYSWQDSDEKLEVLLNNLFKSRISDIMSNSSNKISSSSIDNINNLFEQDILKSVKLLDVNKLK